MTKYIIVEDEHYACKELKRMIKIIRPDYSFCANTKSIKDTLLYLRNNHVDIIFMDVQLSDGNCFEIFNHQNIDTPIIFTTAYDEYATKAFKERSIDYLLKPINEVELMDALDKFEQIYSSQNNLHGTETIHNTMKHDYKRRFLISKKDTIFYAEDKDIAFFYSEDKAVILHTFDSKKYIIDYSLENIEAQVDKKMFHRVSRNCIANIKSIESVKRYFNGRLKIYFKPECSLEVIVSRNRLSDFMNWMGDNNK